MSLYCPHCGHFVGPAEERPPQPLTPKQTRLLRFIAESIDRDGYAPSFPEIAARFGYRSLATVHEYLQTLETKGHIRREFNKARSIVVVHQRAHAA